MTSSQIDHCNVSNPDTYHVLSWMMVGQFTLGLPLNLSVLYVFLFRFKFWRNKSVFLFNIVVADFLLVICLPIKIHDFQHNLRRSETDAVCKTMLFMLFLNRGASIVFLILLSLDRYFSVVHLGRRNCIKAFNKTPLKCVGIWILLLVLTTPTMVGTFDCCNSLGRGPNETEHTATDVCREFIFFTQIIIPFVILVFCTSRIIRRLRQKTVGEKTRLRRAVFAVMSVVVVFSLCFLPCAVARVALLSVRLKKDEATEEVVVQVYDSLMVLSYTDCLLDPLVYCFCNSGFKDAYISSFFPKVLQKRLLRPDPNNTTTVTTATPSIPKITSTVT
ncbi:hydroxycarboxylic acid receptor 2 [Oryzias melastigma]|uniref:G protein-coupled receptor 31 n=1 Tax=Oryzias melastigma TaxID=30732 RepID=A0A3B3DQ95_ORYME|nr:hydroxycarboxylic acid receptor 2 [Oryzias melastigma]XP_036066573.1 hydroxycarboxylic acid receptor 2 [Oryzias melastigma]XP_036066574.1 hydroxycarboxylic acid receptor 2 [Oryzias melastigma]XP_036066575.1 hydroxycarboxylic acid receptor 2 [Oryzias melastigma]